MFIKENVFVLELRHIFGMVIDDDGNPLGLNEELKIFHRTLEKTKKDYPLFTVRLIVCSLKILTIEHTIKMMQATQEGKAISELVVGFDMVNEEDKVPPIIDFVKTIREFQEKDHFPVILHAGESCDRNNTNIVDAILMGTKRIGHGFGLAKHPHLQELVKKRGICIECCPVSNLVLGYTLDLRTHPVRSFLH